MACDADKVVCTADRLVCTAGIFKQNGCESILPFETNVSKKLMNRRVQVAKFEKQQSTLTAAIRALAPVLTTIIRVGGEIMVTWIRYAHH